MAGPYYFDEAAADRAVRFFQKILKHSKGRFAGKPFELLPWQSEQVIRPLFGWKREDGTRRYRRASIWVPKKNGKSTLAAGLILYTLVADNEPGAEIYGAAADRAQASIVYNEVAAMVSQSADLSRVLTVQQSHRRIVYPRKHSSYQVLSKDSRKTGHGVNAHCCVIDELHVVDRELYDTLRYAGAARLQPLMIEISTAGNDKMSLGYERYLYAKRLLAGEIHDPETLAVVYEAESDSVWEQEDQWHRANPSLGTTITVDSFRSDFREAQKGSPSTQASFKQLRLNLWQDSVFAWLPVDCWDACAAPIPPEQLRELPFWGGLDLSSKMDLTAWVRLYLLPENRWYLTARFWAPGEADKQRQKLNRQQLAPWFQSGHITEISGNVISYDQIEKAILADCREGNCRAIAYDPWNAPQLVQHLQDEGVRCVEFRQSILTYNHPMKEFERLVLSGRLQHDGSPVMRWMVAHCSARKDSSGNQRPDKKSSSDHIDGVTAGIMSLGLGLLESQSGTSVYESHGLEIL